MKIRLEEEKDYKIVENLTRDAFWNKYRPGCIEHLVVNKLRNNSRFIKELDYVIEKDNKIIGSIFYSLGYIKTKDNKVLDVLIFGPVSIDPNYQHMGYGETLINYTLEIAKKLNYDLVLITGNPDYYKKYGFVLSSTYNIYYEGLENEESPFFMVKVLNEKNITKYEGIYSDPEIFNVTEEEVSDFDKNFPPKEKLVLAGQLN